MTPQERPFAGDKVAKKLHATTSASDWADEFMRIHGAKLPTWGIMVAWFANAIETGRTFGQTGERGA